MKAERTWQHKSGDLVGVTVTRQYVCYWRHDAGQVWERVELHDWIAGAWPERLSFYVGAAAEEVRGYVQELVEEAASEWDIYD